MTLSAVLLVGGESRRMGVDKATLEVEGTALWARQLAILRGLPLNKIFVSARSTPAWCPREVEVVPDEPPSRGPLSGIAATLKKLPATHLLALAIDLPKMTTAHLEKLWSQARPGVGVIPQNEEHLDPLCAIYPAEASNLAEHRLTQENVSMRKFVQQLFDEHLIHIYHVNKSDQALYHNLNFPMDFE